MFWRFGFNNASSIDSLLDRDDVQLEALLEEDDLLQECKSQNTRLIEYFAREDVLKKLLGYVTGQTESDEKGRFKYPYIATEVLCSEIWSIVETCMRESDHLLVPFWETVLDRPPEEMKSQMIMASHFSKINSTFLTKKPEEMIAFIQAQPNVVDRILQHIETSPFVDLLVRIIQLDEHAAGSGVLEWLSSQNFIGKLLDLLSPQHTTEVHSIVTELIKGIISMATPSPAAGITDAHSNGPASNRFARELAKRETITKLLSFMLYNFDSLPDEAKPAEAGAPELKGKEKGAQEVGVPSSSSSTTLSSPNQNGGEKKGELGDASAGESVPPVASAPTVPNRDSATSSVVHSIAVVIELIRKNNSDYFEPYLFHTLRNRLIQVQQQSHSQGEDTRIALEETMKEMVNRMGVVHLGPVLELMCDNLGEFHKFLKEPRSLQGPISTTVGHIMPLTLERYRILELLAELLHCSNMSLLNRPIEYHHLYDLEGRLQGGLTALEELAAVIAMNNQNEPRQEDLSDEEDDVKPAREFPIRAVTQDSPSLDSDEDMDEPGSSEDEDMEEIAMYDEPNGMDIFSPTSPSPISATLSSPFSNSDTASIESTGSSPSTPMMERERPSRRLSARSIGSRRSSRRRHTMDQSIEVKLPIGEQLKKQFLDMNLFSTLLDLFFEFPWNNFLHSAVYDLIHQVLTGNVDSGRNRELAISLFRDAKIMHRIVEGQARNDKDTATTKGSRLGYMGHLTLIAEDVITALEHFPPELRLLIIQYAPEEEWDRYVTGRYLETKANDTRLLGGGKPVVAARNVSQWKVDEDELAAEGSGSAGGTPRGGMKSEFKRAGSEPPRNSAHFAPSSIEEEEEDDDEDSTRASHFARYLEQEMHSSDQFNSSDDDDDDDEGWLSQSNFGMREPPVSPLHQSTERRPLSASGFDDAFVPPTSRIMGITGTSGMHAPDDDDGFGPFSDAAAVGGSDIFSFSSSSLSEDMDDASFESFGDFGDFQSASVFEHDDSAEHSGSELTPTVGDSWTFTPNPASSRTRGMGNGGDASDDSAVSLDSVEDAVMGGGIGENLKKV
ncbi:SIT4 phosphatase-associated protein-domain-containing protein [Ephemerocybe angulata]|uniref:SIT4 phosphatase-associated protein-domain-containing protein n=1 Tax=Ephemerocybe angulata TaxID=980116 RepID=A0A8H6IFS2_9AGAR|nr:SIT4 phosphatase-associated protein-domain-containing protein [Tulosesus angulatus]